ncbi:hypothetical protein H8K47_03205 [Undibacterium sp. CY7W]|uniref:DUF1453 domain-containing protein n=1 Tax=Undibacterium rugosum TaxID=2762291 RepID=A0A923I6B4_9BURK|nr:DUF6622 family protein [Undibacterium rugosum]MBC3934363.1 hypothetical protein [Undibacterium rugosum]
MLQQILSHTPVWVWVVLATLLVFGTLASRDRVQNLRRLTLLPVLMAGLSIQGQLQQFGWNALALLSWAGAVWLGAQLAVRMADADGLRVESASHIWVRGSWLPLTLMMLIFVGKYVQGMVFAMQPALRTDTGAILVCSIAFGLVNGILLSKLLRVRQLLKNAQPAAALQTASV